MQAAKLLGTVEVTVLDSFAVETKKSVYPTTRWGYTLKG